MAQHNKPGDQYQQFQNDSGVPEYAQHQQYNQPQHQVNMPQVMVQPNCGVQTFTVETSMEPWTWCHLVTGMISFFCCTLFGLISTVMAILSYVDYRGKEYERHRAKKSCAYGFGIAGIVIGSITIVALIIFAAVTAAETVNVIHDINNMNNDYNG